MSFDKYRYGSDVKEEEVRKIGCLDSRVCQQLWDKDRKPEVSTTCVEQITPRKAHPYVCAVVCGCLNFSSQNRVSEYDENVVVGWEYVQAMYVKGEGKPVPPTNACPSV